MDKNKKINSLLINLKQSAQNSFPGLYVTNYVSFKSYKELSLSSLIYRIRRDISFKSIVMFVRNSEISANIVESAFSESLIEKNLDLFISALLLAFIDAGKKEIAENLSSLLIDSDLIWSKALANSYLLDRELKIYDPLRISA